MTDEQRFLYPLFQTKRPCPLVDVKRKRNQGSSFGSKRAGAKMIKKATRIEARKNKIVELTQFAVLLRKTVTSKLSPKSAKTVSLVFWEKKIKNRPSKAAMILASSFCRQSTPYRRASNWGCFFQEKMMKFELYFTFLALPLTFPSCFDLVVGQYFW